MDSIHAESETPERYRFAKTRRSAWQFACAALALAVAAALSACNGGGSPGGAGSAYRTTTLNVTVGSGTQVPAGGLHLFPQAFLGTFGDVSNVTVVVSGLDKYGVFHNPLATTTLTLSGGVWSGSIPDLPVGPTLTFTAHGYNASAVEIFSGATTMVLTGSADAVAIAMSPIDNGVPVLFPIIASITRPAEIAHDTAVTVAVGVRGSPSETLNYGFTSGGGIYAPPAGSIGLPGSGTGTIDSTYTAPASLGTYLHSVRLTNSQGNTVESDFTTTVVNAVTTPGVGTTFAPVIGALMGKRTGNTVAWTATVTDDAPLSALTYAWSFTHTGGTLGSTFSTAAANPGIQSGYDQTVTGTISLTVTDGDGLSTTITFTLVPGQFSDNLVVTGGADIYQNGDGIAELTAAPWLTPSPFGPGDTVSVSVPVDSDTGYVRTCIVAQLTDDFMNGMDRGCGDLVRTPAAGTAVLPVTLDPVLPAGNSYWIVVFTTPSQAAYNSMTGTIYWSVSGSTTYFKQPVLSGVPAISNDTGIAIPLFASAGGSLPLVYTNGDGMAEMAGTPTVNKTTLSASSDTSIVVTVPVDSDSGGACVSVGENYNNGSGAPPWHERGNSCHAVGVPGTQQNLQITVPLAGLTAGTTLSISTGMELPVMPPPGVNANTSWYYASSKNPGTFSVVKYPGTNTGVNSETGVPIPTITVGP